MIESATHEVQIEEQSMSSDDTVFMDLPLPPIPARAVQIYNVVDVYPSITSLLCARMDDFHEAPQQSPELYSSSSQSSIQSTTEAEIVKLQNDENKWATSDEESSFYREKISMFRSESLTPKARLHQQHEYFTGCNNYYNKIRKIKRLFKET